MRSLLPKLFSRLGPGRRSGRSRQPSSPARGRSRTMRVEPLEARRMLAIVSFDIRVFEDNAGTLGPEIPDAEVTVGDSFWVEVRVEDVPDPVEDGNDVSAGIVGLGIDTRWDEGMIQFQGSPALDPPGDDKAVDPGNPLVTDRLPTERFVSTVIDDGAALENDGFNDLQGLELLGADPIGAGASEWFSRIFFEAGDITGETDFVILGLGELSAGFADADMPTGIGGELVQTITIVDPPEDAASLSGFVYVDSDNNGVLRVDEYGSPIELGLPNVLVSLYRDGTLLDQVTTGPGGRYDFQELEPGTYRIVESQPDCYHDGQDTLGQVLPDGEARGEDDLNDEFYGIELDEGEHGVDYNFGELGLRAGCINKRMFLASTPSTKEVAAEAVGVATETVLGSSGDDVIEFVADLGAAEPSLDVTVTEVDTGVVREYEFPIAETQLVFIDAQGGNDTATLTLTDGDEQAYLRPGYATVRREVVEAAVRDWDYGVEVVGAETVEVIDLAPEDNFVVMRDTPQSDALTAEGDLAELQTQDLERIARAVLAAEIQAISASGGTDTAEETAPTFVLDLVGNWQAP